MNAEKIIKLGEVILKEGKIVEIYMQVSSEGYDWRKGRITKVSEEDATFDFSTKMHSNIERIPFRTIYKIRE